MRDDITKIERKTKIKIGLNFKFNNHKSERSKYSIPEKNQICLVINAPNSEITVYLKNPELIAKKKFGLFILPAPTIAVQASITNNKTLVKCVSLSNSSNFD